MANGLDKLEKLFSKKKAAPSRSSTGPNIYGTVPLSPEQSELPQPLFPQPSFIRPKASRMLARDEIASPSPKSFLRHTPSHSQSTTTSLSSGEVLDMNFVRRQNSSHSSNVSPPVPSRATSLLARRRDAPIGGIAPLRLPGVPQSSIDDSLYSRQCSFADERNSQSLRKGTQSALLDPLPIFPGLRVDTPPPSDHDEGSSPKSLERDRTQPSRPLLSQPTPGPSPDMIPTRDSLLSEPKTSSDLQSRNGSRPSSKEAAPPTLRIFPPIRPRKEACVLPLPKEPSQPSRVVLQEPRVKDVLSLTDDDIAETARSALPLQPPKELPPPPPVLPPSVRCPPFAPVQGRILPCSPLSRGPNTMAALEAARIAKKYDFDLLYIVNLWPAQMSHLHEACIAKQASALPSPIESVGTPSLQSSSTSSKCDSASRSRLRPLPDMNPCMDCDGQMPNISTRTGITGRILAAYGLHSLEPPFRLSGVTHKKILNSDGWMEWRHDNAKDDEFTRGWACSFYTGQAPEGRRNSVPEQEAGAKKGRRKTRSSSGNNRGIVFAAYRKPRGDGGSVQSCQAELSALYKEAESLIELLIDFHVAQRRQVLFQVTTSRRNSE